MEELQTTAGYREQLAGLLRQVVADGASVGFLPPMTEQAAEGYWEQVLAPDIRLWAAFAGTQLIGTVQLQLCTKPNGTHRAEICKLMAHPQARRRGVGRLLMQAAEAKAREEGRSLLVLDTREGDVSNVLYASLGFIEAGRIPQYAMSADGQLHSTVLYYKFL